MGGGGGGGQAGSKVRGLQEFPSMKNLIAHWGPVQCNIPSALALDGPVCGQIEAISSMKLAP